jgi:hypothetical protein
MIHGTSEESPLAPSPSGRNMRTTRYPVALQTRIARILEFPDSEIHPITRARTYPA